MDHSFGESTNYHRPTEDELLEDYLKVADSLTVNEENRLKLQVQLLKDDSNEIQQLKKQVNENNAMLQDFVNLIKLKWQNDNTSASKDEFYEQEKKIKEIDKRLSTKGLKEHKLL